MDNKKINPDCKKENAKGVFKQMLADKRKIQAYIREHGSLKGFDGEGIRFAKPL